MDRRLQLHNILVNILGSSNVYFQPPSTVQMKYPCIVYSREKIDAKFADNIIYLNKKRYQVTVIDSDPDSSISGEVMKLPYCQFDRHFTANNHNHDVFNIYY